jgi:hypothetical protein
MLHEVTALVGAWGGYFFFAMLIIRVAKAMSIETKA